MLEKWMFKAWGVDRVIYENRESGTEYVMEPGKKTIKGKIMVVAKKKKRKPKPDKDRD